jgi:DNA-3-methyladenine glycosylase
LNAVAEPEGYPAAVLLRSITARENFEEMAHNRPSLAGTKHWTDGPAKLTQALDLDSRLNNCDLCDPSGNLFIEAASQVFLDDQVETGPRVGLFTVPEPWKSVPWRFRLQI